MLSHTDTFLHFWDYFKKYSSCTRKSRRKDIWKLSLDLHIINQATSVEGFLIHPNPPEPHSPLPPSILFLAHYPHPPRLGWLLLFERTVSTSELNCVLFGILPIVLSLVRPWRAKSFFPASLKKFGQIVIFECNVKIHWQRFLQKLAFHLVQHFLSCLRDLLGEGAHFWVLRSRFSWTFRSCGEEVKWTLTGFLNFQVVKSLTCRISLDLAKRRRIPV